MFTAPEVFAKSYDKKCDLWSCGVILYLMLSGEVPFKAKTKEELIVQITKGQYNFDSPAWKDVSEEAKRFIQKLLTVDPKTRYCAKKALKDPWITSHSNKNINTNEALATTAINNLKSYRVTYNNYLIIEISNF